MMSSRADAWNVGEEDQSTARLRDRKDPKKLEKLRKEVMRQHLDRMQRLREWIARKTGTEIRIRWRRYIINAIEVYIPPPDNIGYAIFDTPFIQWEKRAALIYLHMAPKTSGLPVYIALFVSFEFFHELGDYNNEIEYIIDNILYRNDVLRGVMASNDLAELGFRRMVVCGPLCACPWLIYKHMGGDLRDAFVIFIPPNEISIVRDRLENMRRACRRLVDIVADEEGELENREIRVHKCYGRYNIIPLSISMQLIKSALEEKKRKAVLVNETYQCNKQLTSIYIPGRNIVFREDMTGIPYMIATTHVRRDYIAPILLHAIYSYVMNRPPSSDASSNFVLRNVVRNTLAKILLEARTVTARIRYPRINTRICRENNVDVVVSDEGIKIIIPVSGEIKYFFANGGKKIIPLKRPMKYNGEVILPLALEGTKLMHPLSGMDSVLSRIVVVDPVTGEKFPHPNTGARDRSDYNKYLRTCLGTATDTIARMSIEEGEDLCSYAARIARLVRDVLSKPGMDALNPHLLIHLKKNGLLGEQRPIEW